tara:strand:- start:391 stop:642 length:252 start_codon:yes stop_codon:yes gene_type:complete
MTKPGTAAEYLDRGYANNARSQYAEAIFDYRKVIELNPKDDNAHFHPGFIKKKIGEIQGARSDWKKAAALGNDDTQELVKKNG